MKAFLFMLLIAGTAFAATKGAPGWETGPGDKWVACGDSITLGVRNGVTVEQTWVRQLAYRAAWAGRNTTDINTAVANSTIMQGQSAASGVLSEHQPRMTLIMYGTNDSSVVSGYTTPRVPLDMYESLLEQTVLQYRAAGVRVLLVAPPPWGEGELTMYPEHVTSFNPRLETYVQAMRAVAARTSVPIADLYAHCRERQAVGVQLAWWMLDQCHPDPRGHAMIAEFLWPYFWQELTRP
jgi:lysophospholipase L1-like esterase